MNFYQFNLLLENDILPPDWMFSVSLLPKKANMGWGELQDELNCYLRYGMAKFLVKYGLWQGPPPDFTDQLLYLKPPFPECRLQNFLDSHYQNPANPRIKVWVLPPHPKYKSEDWLEKLIFDCTLISEGEYGFNMGKAERMWKKYYNDVTLRTPKQKKLAYHAELWGVFEEMILCITKAYFQKIGAKYGGQVVFGNPSEAPPQDFIQQIRDRMDNGGFVYELPHDSSLDERLYFNKEFQPIFDKIGPPKGGMAVLNLIYLQPDEIPSTVIKLDNLGFTPNPQQQDMISQLKYIMKTAEIKKADLMIRKK